MFIDRRFFGRLCLPVLMAAGLSACSPTRPVAAQGHEGHGGVTAERTPARRALYRCPMHPSYVSDKPGDCPICGMRLVPMEEGEEPPPAGPGVEGRVPVAITAERRQLIGVKYGAVERRPLVKVIRSVGTVAYDPDLYRAETEYLGALARVGGGGGGNPLVGAARLRLRQLGLNDALIGELGRARKPHENLLLPGESAWVYAQVFEYEVGWVRAGESLQATALAVPGKTFEGRIRAVDSVIDASTRTVRIRAEVENPSLLLKPDMFVNVEIRADLGTRLAIPESAVLDSGLARLAFVRRGEGTFDPREIKLGAEAEGYFEVLDGLREGEIVVTSANFLIDSESRLKAAASAMSSMPGMP